MQQTTEMSSMKLIHVHLSSTAIQKQQLKKYELKKTHQCILEQN